MSPAIFRDGSFQNRTGETRAVSNSDGTLFLASAQKWGIYVIPMDDEGRAMR
jgi:hypothetical protein